MQCHLVVVRAFGAYAKGEAITEAEAIARVLAGANAGCVVRVRSSAKEG
ncbi:MAG TPA: hypothetical protein VL154_03310 [Acetobacteraceae bacterium]|jgi:hypothetical protein|nr:hypothetical protein [Acetobacteraceae bacterium]